MSDRTCQVDGCDHPMPTGDNSTACPACWNRLERDLAQMPALVEELNTTITKQARVYLESSGTAGIEADDPSDVDPRGLLPGLRALRPQPTVTRAAAKPLPLNVGASEAMEDLQRTLWWWVREGMDAHPDVRFSGSVDVTGLSRALLRLHGWLQGHPEGYLAVEAIAADVKSATRAIDRATERKCLGRCGNELNGVVCEAWLYAGRNAPTVRCTTCGAEYDVDERQYGLLDLAHDRLVTTVEACAAVRTYGPDGQNITGAMVRGWSFRGRLEPKAHDAKGRPLWRLGDVVDLAIGRG